MAIDSTLQVQLDLIRHSKTVDLALVDLFTVMKNQVVDELSRENLTEISRSRLNAILAETSQTIKAFYERARLSVEPSIAMAAKIVTENEPLSVAQLEVTLAKIDQYLGYRLVNVDVSKFEALFKKDLTFYIGPDGVGGINGRYDRVRQFITANQTFEASSVIVTPDGVAFNNGRHRYAALRDAANQVIPMAMDEASIAAAEQLGLIVKAGDPSTVEMLAKAVIPSKEVMAALVSNIIIEGQPAALWWKKQSLSVAFQFSNLIRQGVALGETNEQIFRRVGQITDLASRNSRALVHTSIMQVAGDARMAVIGANADIYVGYRQLSTLDGHTTPICIARSGLKWDLDKLPIGHDVPFKQTPLHWGCRSIIMGLLRPMADFGLKEVRGQTRASAEGQIAKDTSFEEFLKRRTPAQQEAQLGVGRVELWREGKISLRQLIDNAGNPLTLSELKRRYDH